VDLRAQEGIAVPGEDPLDIRPSEVLVDSCEGREDLGVTTPF
jgi:hypothetical protein